MKKHCKRFSELEIDVYKNDIGHEKWNELMDQFIGHIETDLDERISLSITLSKNVYNDFLVLEFFRTVMHPYKAKDILFPKYAYPLQKFVADIKIFNEQFKVRS